MSLRLTSLVLTSLIVLAACLLAGCGVETQAGVILATVVVTPTTTPVPTPTLDPLTMDLPYTLSRDFMGTVVTFGYPQDWETEERGQYAFVFDATGATDVEQPPSIIVFIQLSRRFGLDETLDPMAPYALSAQHQGIIEYGFLDPAAALLPDEALAFRWGEHDAAAYHWQTDDGGAVGLGLIVMSTDRRRFAWIHASSAGSRWDAFRPTLEAILSTVTLDGESLPAADVLAAVRGTEE